MQTSAMYDGPGNTVTEILTSHLLWDLVAEAARPDHSPVDARIAHKVLTLQEQHALQVS